MKRLPTSAVPVIAAVAAVPTCLAPNSLLAQVTYTVAFSALVVLAWLGNRRRTGRARLAHGLMAGALTA